MGAVIVYFNLVDKECFTEQHRENGEKDETEKKKKTPVRQRESPPLSRDSGPASGSWPSLRLHTDKEMAAHPRQQKRGRSHAGL